MLFLRCIVIGAGPGDERRGFSACGAMDDVVGYHLGGVHIEGC